MLEELNWRERYVYFFLKENTDKRYNNVKELYDSTGMYYKNARSLVHSLERKGYILWSPKNPDGRFYVLLK